MFTNFSEFLVCVKEARFTFDVIWQWITSIFKAITENPDVQAVWNALASLIAPIYTSFIVIAIICCLLSVFFGRKIIGVIKFFVFFVLGFFLATHFLAPVLPSGMHIPPWLIGLVVALIAAILSKFIYTLFYLIFFSYGTYAMIFFVLLLNPAETYTDTKAIVCLVISIVVTILALVFRKYIEMLATSVLGSWAAVTLFVGNIYDFSAWQMFGGRAWVAILVVTAILSLLGFIVQVATRRRY